MCQIVVKEVQNLQVLTESWSINLTANEHSHRRGEAREYESLSYATLLQIFPSKQATVYPESDS